jgi:hypothetical protein
MRSIVEEHLRRVTAATISYSSMADFCRRTQNFKAAYCSSRTDSISHMQLPTTRAFTAHCCWTHARMRFLGCVRIPLVPVFTLQLVSSPFVHCVLQSKFILTRFWLALVFWVSGNRTFWWAHESRFFFFPLQPEDLKAYIPSLKPCGLF